MAREGTLERKEMDKFQEMENGSWVSSLNSEEKKWKGIKK